MCWAAHELELDRLIVVPAGDPWQKTAQVPVTSPDIRLRLAEAMVGSLVSPDSDLPCRIEVSDVEVRRSGPSYMVDTLIELDLGLPFLVLGADSAASLRSWHRCGEVASRCVIAWGARPGVEEPEFAADWTHCRFDLPALELDSTSIRRWARDGRPLSGLVPDEVVSILDAQGLYRVDR